MQRAKTNLGRMDVRLTIHGGAPAMLTILDTLIDQNADLIKNGVVPAQPPTKLAVSGFNLRYLDEPTWRDAAAVIVEGGRASSGSLAAWEAAGYRLRGHHDASLGLLSNGNVAVFSAESGALIADPAGSLGVRSSSAHNPHGVVATSFKPGPSSRVQERMIVSLIDDRAEPVRSFGNAIARHNARRILSQGLPGIYQSGVVYQPEGSPELWWDAEEILTNGFDDCEGLAAYRAGELLAHGVSADVWTRRIQPPDGSRSNRALFHALTRARLPNGTVVYDDPSVRLGMPVPKWYQDQSAERRKKGLTL